MGRSHIIKGTNQLRANDGLLALPSKVVKRPFMSVLSLLALLPVVVSESVPATRVDVQQLWGVGHFAREGIVLVELGTGKANSLPSSFRLPA